MTARRLGGSTSFYKPPLTKLDLPRGSEVTITTGPSNAPEVAR